jgi:uncharacterized membrane protein (UPF0127 family)
MKETISVLLIVAILLGVGWSFYSLTQTIPTNIHPARLQNIFLNDTRIQVEVVSSSEDVRRGLSDRPSLDHDRGMLFELGTRGIHPFWMHRMHFPIDMIWIDGDTAVEIAENVPHPRFGEIPYTHVPKAEGDRVLELNAGLVDEIGLEVGDTIGGLTEE